MNTMKRAHELTKARIAKGTIYTYAELMKRHLIQAHTEYKAMTKVNPFDKVIKSTETYIAELEAALLDRDAVQGFIVVTGEGRICVNAEIGHATNVLKAPIYMHLEDAEYYAGRVKNGNGDKGEVVGKYSQLKYEIEQQQQLLNELKKV